MHTCEFRIRQSACLLKHSDSLHLDITALVNAKNGFLIKLLDAHKEVGTLRLEITKLEDGEAELKVKLESSIAEVGKLSHNFKIEVN